MHDSDKMRIVTPQKQQPIAKEQIMKYSTLHKTSFFLTFTIMVAVVTTAMAQGPRRGIFGDWNITTQFGERPFESILEFSQGAEGSLKGSWITFFGLTELKDVKYEDNQLSFTQTFRGREGETTSKFSGVIEEGKLTGTLSSDRGESEVAGKRAPRISRAVGGWAMKIKVGEREFTGTLNIKSDSGGDLVGKWSSQRGEQEVDALAYSRGELSFTRTIKTQDNEWESAFKGNIRGNAITGVSTSDRGEAEMVGERIGGAAIGTWNLDLASERGSRSQRLWINADMSALYGSSAIDKITLGGNQLSFRYAVQFGDREFESDFQGRIDGDTLTGELTTSQGARKVTGKKVVSSFRRRR